MPSPLPIDRHLEYNKTELFMISVIALVTAGIAAAVRARIAPELKTIFLDPINPLGSAGMIGSVLGVAFLDAIGMGRMLGLACGCFTVGTLMTLFTAELSGVSSLY